MKVRDFSSRLDEIQTNRSSVVCVGLDPDADRLPRHLARLAAADAVVTFNRTIIEATSDLVCAFKLNLAFYEALGAEGWSVLEKTLEAIPDEVLSIADGKRSDIGNTAQYYAASLFERLSFDACTVSPYMGRESVVPFLEHPGKGVFVLARTSNPGADELQTLEFGGRRLFEIVAERASEWARGMPGELGLVTGATDTEAIGAVRAACPGVPLLIPGIGAQGGDAAAVMTAAAGGPVIINSSRQIIYASPDEDFADSAREQVEALRRALDQLRSLP